MIVRTYGRRSRGLTYSDSIDDVVPDESFRDSFSLSQENPYQDLYSLPFSSQESSSLWPPFDPDPYNFDSSQYNDFLDGSGARKSKKPRNGKVERAAPKNCNSGSLAPFTSTLMEAQEFGEMMEHVDEVNFALDGLKKGQPVRIRRASLLSLLSICGTAHQRRLLRAQGLAKTIIDAILGLSFDDLSSNLAASTLFYVLTGDGQDEDLLELPGCIHFLIKLLKPVNSSATEDKARNFGSKILAVRKDSGILRDANKPVDSSSVAIVAKVQEILVNCKDMNSLFEDDSGMQRPEISPKWIALLTMEKACLSKISFEDTSGTVRKTGGNFKEKFRELGGLDAVVEVLMNCHSIMESCKENGSPTMQEKRDDSQLQSLVLLMKCLKIMENATFLSKDNQDHLLGLKNFDSYGCRVSFTKLIISIIKILSGLYLLKTSRTASDKGKPCYLSDSGVCISNSAFVEDRKGDNEIIFISSSSAGKPCNLSDSGVHNSDLALVTDRKDDDAIICISSSNCCSSEGALSEKNYIKYQKSNFQFDFPASSSETSATFVNDASQLRLRVSSSTSSSCSGSSRTSNSGRFLSSNGLRTKFGFPDRTKCKNITNSELLEDKLDPFAFVEDEIQPSKWDLLSGKKKKSRPRNRHATSRQLEDRQLEDMCQYRPGSQDKSSRAENFQQKSRNTEHQSSQTKSRCNAAEEEHFGLLVDCLLTAVKVLMNLTNDNPIGCEQIAACGGLETMSYLIACHFPSFGSPSSYIKAIKEDISCIEMDNKKDNHLTDQELDFLVSVLGLLVNLVEKDGHNRSRLAATTVSLPRSEASDKDLISLLCSVFLANQGAGDANGDGNVMEWNDEAALLQGEKEAEKMIVEAYAALLLAFLSTESKRIRDSIAAWLPNRSLAILVPVLERFVAFHLTLNMISPETHKAVTEVIESCRIP